MKDDKTVNDQVQVVDIQFRPGQKVYFFDPVNKTYQAGDHVIIDTARGPEYGICTAGNHMVAAKNVVAPLRPVLRLATAQDERAVEANRAREKHAFQVCLEQIRQQGLDMQLTGTECAFDGSKLMFFFTADERVDFRELVKTLAGIFHTRIELRQIGVRDKARMVGGLGICGRPFCCASFLDDFQPVSIKMAKTQNLSLNPTKISGTCGRLMCCLKYEQDAYEDLIKSSPKAESFVDTPDGRGTVTELSLLRQRVKVRMEEDEETIGTYRVDEIAVFRNGKAKKTDEPIPADWAPISGGGRRRSKLRGIDAEEAGLEPVKFRYRNEPVEEPEAPAPAPEEKPKENRQNRRNRKGQKPEQKPQAAPEQTKAPQKAKKPQPAEKPAQPQAAQEGNQNTEQKKPNRRRHHHYRHKPKQSGEGK